MAPELGCPSREQKAQMSGRISPMLQGDVLSMLSSPSHPKCHSWLQLHCLRSSSNPVQMFLIEAFLSLTG